MSPEPRSRPAAAAGARGVFRWHWHDTIYNLRPGSRADEIRHSLSEKISEVSDKIHSKHGRIRELLAAIREIEENLREGGK